MLIKDDYKHPVQQGECLKQRADDELQHYEPFNSSQ